MYARFWLPALVLLGLVGCQNAAPPKSRTTFATPKTIKLKPGPNAQEVVQTALLRARSGDRLEFSGGVFEFTQGLTLAVEGVTLRGQGMDQTILSFKNQATGPAALSVIAGNFICEDLTIDDAQGDALRVQDGDGIQLRRVQARWNGESNAASGSNGFYPSQCKQVVIEDCVVIGASNAGIHVGQSQNVVVRRCRAERNTAGIEIDNCTNVDVSECAATGNASGILVMDLPNLLAKNGRRVRLFDNEVLANNRVNLAPEGAIVASIPPGTGVMVMATDEVEIFKNTINEHDTVSVCVASFDITGRPIIDREYDSIPEGVSIHDNIISGGGQRPGGIWGLSLVTLLGEPIPDILYDGVENPGRKVKGTLPQFGISIRNNGKATFANLHWKELDLKLPFRSRDKITRDLKPHQFDLPALPAVVIRECP